jgi:excisionase family DNA binding protein
MASEDWLELSEAAGLLGIHASTLRRWADAGKIAYTRTLSGRRRFRRTAVEQARTDMDQSVTLQAAQQLQARTLNFTHQPSGDVVIRQGAWFSRLSEEQLLLFRYSGQRMMGLMMQFISREEGAETFLEEGKRVASDYGLICFRAGLSISQTTEAFLHFRRSFLESVQTTSGLNGPHDSDGHRIVLRTSDFYDAMLVSTIESYARLSQSG